MFGSQPGAGVDFGGVGAAGRRGGERAALAFAEVDVEVRVGQLGQVVEGGGELPGGRIGVDPAGDLDQDPALGRLGDQVEGEQGAEGVLVAGSRRTASLRSRLRRAGFRSTSSPILESLGQPAPGGEVIVSAAYWASEQVPRPAATDGLTVIPSGRVTTAFLTCEVARAAGSSSGALLPSRVKSKPVGERGAVGREAPARDRVEGELVAARAAAAARSRSLGTGAGCCQEVGGDGEGERARRRRSAGSGRPGLGCGGLQVGDRAFGVAEGGVDLVQAVAALAVVGDRPGGAPDLQSEARSRRAAGRSS